MPGLPVESIEAIEAGDLPGGGLAIADTVLDVEVTSNRSDCLSHLGIARELSALLDRPLTAPQLRPSETATPFAEDSGDAEWIASEQRGSRECPALSAIHRPIDPGRAHRPQPQLDGTPAARGGLASDQ